VGGAPPANQPLSGQEAAEASTGIAFSTFQMVGGVFNAIPDLGDLGGKTAVPARVKPVIDLALEAAAIAKRRADAAARVVVPCDGSGTRDVSCTADEAGSHFTGVFVDCTSPSAGTFTTVDGTITLDVADPLACAADSFPDSVAVTITFENFSIVIKDSSDLILYSFNADLTIANAPSTPGCPGEGRNGTLSLDGTLSAVSIFEGLTLTIIADNLSITTSSAGGDTCTTTALVTGGAFISDGETSFSEVVDLTLTRTDYGVNDCLTIDGTASTNCTGGLTFDTVEPICSLEGSCPSAGVLDVTLADDTVARVAFIGAGYLTLDYPMDGTPDVTFDSCDSDSIEHCHAAAAKR
jgi:hypothetical protein